MVRRVAAALLTSTALIASAIALAADAPAPLAAPSGPPAVEQSPREFSRHADPGKAAQEIDLARLRLREGTRLRDVAGRFRQSGDSLTFIDGEGREINGLPNLNMERVLRMLKTVEEPESITWSVSGMVTEFSGRNYLLISRAVYKAAAPPPAPESLTEPEAPVAQAP